MTMIQQLKTALLGDTPGTDTGWPTESHDADEADDAPAASHVDPFRPAVTLESDSDREQLDMDQIFGILGNRRRRYALKYLSTSEESIGMNELVEHIAAWECEKRVGQITSKERKRVYVSMYQSHLPKLAEAEAISYDERGGIIECGERFEQFSHYLRDDE